MDSIVYTPRLKLTLITKAERGSAELEWMHELRCSEGAMLWSLSGRAKSIEDTEMVMKETLPRDEGEQNSYRVAYAVHKVLESRSGSVEDELQPAEQGKRSTEFLGLVNLRSLDGGGLPLPEHLSLTAAAATTTLAIEIAYAFLPVAWGKGYATESVKAVLESCKKARSFWAPSTKLYVQAIVNGGNPASIRVMEKTGMTKRGIYEWTGKPIFLGGKWEERSDLHIFGLHLLE